MENRNSDLEGVHEWCGYTFFYVKFGPQPDDEESVKVVSMVVLSSLFSPVGPGRKTTGDMDRLAQLNRELWKEDEVLLKAKMAPMALARPQGVYDGTAIMARDTAVFEGGPMSGYEARRMGEERLKPPKPRCCRWKTRMRRRGSSR